MGRVSYNPSNDTAGLLILEDGDYEYSILDVSAFDRTNADGKEIYGVRVKLRVESEGDYKGKTILNDLYLHTPKTGGINKGFLLAAYGFALRDERDFNNQFGDPELWFLDRDDKTLGEGWTGLVGRNIRSSTKIVSGLNDQEQNQHRWMPF